MKIVSIYDFFQKFPDEEAARLYLEKKRWNGSIVCPHCGSHKVSECKNHKPMPYRCKECRKHFSVRTGTVLEESRLPLKKWLLAIYMMTSSRKGIPSTQMAKELGYKKPVAGVKKKEQALAKSIIVICPLLSNGYYSMIIHSITERAKDYGYTVFTVSTLRDVSQEELYLNLLSGFELAGVISLYPPTKIAQANALSKQVPVVSIGDKPDACRFDAVELDSKKPGYIIAEHLLSLGHKHITYICTPIRPKEIGRIHRLAGLRSCFKDHGLDPEWVEVKSPTIAAYGRYSADNSEYQNGYDMASQALDEHTSSTAFVGNNDMTAFGIMAAISDHGFRVPHDYSVCGFDNIPLSSMPQIALTTIEHASLAKGREAVDIIYKKNTQKNISAKHHYIMRMEYEPELIVRNSTGKCKITNKTKECHNIS